jgi:hypothetical protein
MTKSELIAALRSIVTGGSPFNTDVDVSSAAAGAAHAIHSRLTGSADLPDKDAMAKPKYEVPGQGGPDRPNPEDDE